MVQQHPKEVPEPPLLPFSRIPYRLRTLQKNAATTDIIGGQSMMSRFLSSKVSGWPLNCGGEPFCIRAPNSGRMGESCHLKLVPHTDRLRLWFLSLGRPRCRTCKAKVRQNTH